MSRLRHFLRYILQRLRPVLAVRGKTSFTSYLVIFALFIATLVAVIPTVQMHQLAEKQWLDLNTRGMLRIGIDPGFQPFSYYDDQGWNGIDADIGREIARRLNLQVQTIPVGYDSLYDALHLWQVDIVLSAVTVDPDRSADYSYSISYFNAGITLVSRQTSSITSRDGLAGKRIAVVLGSDADRAVRYLERRLPNISRFILTDLADAPAILHEGKVDVIAVDALEAMALQSRLSDLSTIQLSTIPYVFGIRRDNPILLSRLNETLADMQRDGTLQAIIARWSSH